MPEIYFDNAATTPLHSQVAGAMTLALQYFANPSSLHRLGLEAEKRNQASRRQVAEFLGVSPDAIFFTSGGTEANNLAIQGALQRPRGRLLASRVEHPSVREIFIHLERQGWPVEWINVDGRGEVDLSHLATLLAEPVKMVSVMAVNNETGSIQPLEEVCRLVRKRQPQAFIHVDAVQAAGKIQFRPIDLDVDTAVVSAHKMLGPKGVGALYVANPGRIKPLFFGGGQEGKLCPGTENTWGITGFAAAAGLWENNNDAWNREVAKLRHQFAAGLEKLGARIVSPDTGSPYILAASFSGHKGEVLVNALSSRGLYVSTGAACSGKKGNLSHVAQAMGLEDDVIQGMLRFSFSPLNEKREVDMALEILTEVLEELAYVRGRSGH